MTLETVKRRERIVHRFLPTLFLKTVFFFFIFAILFLIGGNKTWYPKWFFPQLSGIGALIYASAIALPQIIFKNKHTDPKISEHRSRALIRLQTYLAIGLVMGFMGTLGLFRLGHYGIPYDKILHAGFPFLAIVALSRFIFHWYDTSVGKSLAIATIAIGFSVFLWEGIELGSDLIFLTKSFGEGGENIRIDTFLDVSLGLLGIITSNIAVLLRKKPWP